MENLIEILEKLKQEEYEKYCKIGFSVVGEKEWDYVINNVKEKLALIK